MSYEAKSLNEECGIFDIWDHPDAAQVTYFGSHSSQHRGQEGAEIVANNSGRLSGHRDLGLLTEVLQKQEQLNALEGTAVIGHVRYATAGMGSADNIQPFLFKFYDSQIGLAHNDSLTNAKRLRKQLEREDAIFHSNLDTGILMRLTRKSTAASLLDKLKESLNLVKGGFVYLLLTETMITAALGPSGFRLLFIGQMNNGAYVVASGTCALETVGAHFIQDMAPGEVVIISDEGLKVEAFTTEVQPATCTVEYIYFARPDSNTAGVSVHTVHKRMGKNSAIESPVATDMVTGVPSSSLSAASGYAEEAQIPYELGLVKNQHVARTFIQSTQELREQDVRMKLSTIRGVVKGKKVILVSDSIVRGITIRRIIHLLKEAEAQEVHVRIALSPLRYPCFYGIDIQTRDELIAVNHSVEETKEQIGADSLVLLSETGLIDGIRLNYDAPYPGLRMAYFNGDYPMPLYDYEEQYQASLKKETRRN